MINEKQNWINGIDAILNSKESILSAVDKELLLSIKKAIAQAETKDDLIRIFPAILKLFELGYLIIEKI